MIRSCIVACLLAVSCVSGCAAGTTANPDGGGPGPADAPVVFDPDAPPGTPDAPPPGVPDAAPPGVPDAALVMPDAAPLPPVCGDGMVAGAEECDDGNVIDTDGCRMCTWARCGDAVVRTGVEQCDDGNLTDNDGCSAICLTCNAADASFTWGVNHHCYTRVDAATDWNVARALCDAARGHLVTFELAAENDAVTANLLGTGLNYWMGMHDQTTEGLFVWATEEPIVFTNWAVGEPNDSGLIEDCSELYGAGGGVWNDLNCADVRGRICEDDGWHVRAADNHAYRFIYEAVAWGTALTSCASMGGHLATIGSAAENSFVNGFVGGYGMWIGAGDATVEGTFLWVTGEPFVYTAWAPGEPNDAAMNEDCAETRPGGWNDENCASLRGYVCEVD